MINPCSTYVVGMTWGCFTDVLGIGGGFFSKFCGCFRGVSKVFYRCFKDVLGMLRECFGGCFVDVLGMFQRYFTGVWGTFWGCSGVRFFAPGSGLIRSMALLAVRGSLPALPSGGAETAPEQEEGAARREQKSNGFITFYKFTKIILVRITWLPYFS